MMDIEKFSIEKIVDLQLKAYNEGDYPLFASCYDKNILSFDFETASIISHLSDSSFFDYYRQKFIENPDLHCEVTQRIVHGNLVVDQEIISHFQSQVHKEMVIYQVDGDLITKMWFSKVEPVRVPA
jgi:hypothetical protein